MKTKLSIIIAVVGLALSMTLVVIFIIDSPERRPGKRLEQERIPNMMREIKPLTEAPVFPESRSSK